MSRSRMLDTDREIASEKFWKESRLLNTVTSTTLMDQSKRAAGFYPRKCEYGKCNIPAWYIQEANRSDGSKTQRVVCKGHSMTRKWKS